MDGKARVSLAEIATEAGVSRMTVSRALRSEGSVSPAVRTRVQNIAARLGYQPDARISAVMGAVRRSRRPSYRETLGLVFGRRGGRLDPYSARLQAAVRRRAEALGYRVDSLSLGGSDGGGVRVGAILASRGIRGVIIAPADRSTAWRFDLPWNEISAVAIGSSLAEPRLDRVQGHHHLNLRCALHGLARCGYPRIGLWLPADMDERSDGMFRGAFLACTAAARRIHPGKDARDVRAWIRREKLDAVIGLDAAAGRVVRAPGAGYAALSLDLAGPETAGVDGRLERQAALAVEHLVGLVRRQETGVPSAPVDMLVEGCWRDGASAPRRRGAGAES